MSITWGTTGRGKNRTATVYCAQCREILASDVRIGEARIVRDELESKHQCAAAEQCDLFGEAHA